MTLQVRECSGCVILNEAATEVYLITSSKDRTKWVFPKGGIEAGLTAEENAQKETREEAGVAVTIVQKLDTQDSERDHHDDNAEPGPYISRDTYFLAHFLSFVDWEEYTKRNRGWIKVSEAQALLNGRGGNVLELAIAAQKAITAGANPL
jgi:diphosphoinositol-polyphosphate diphosphatase